MGQKPKTPFKKVTCEVRHPVLHHAILRKIPARMIAKGELYLPAVPALAEHYASLLDQTWRGIGRIFTPTELEYLTNVLRDTAKEAFALSPYSRISVEYETDPLPKTSLTWTISACPSSIEAEYDDWVKTRTPPLFGAHPDAKVMDLAKTLGAPSQCPILDVGAGTGRNTLPLLRLGFPAEALELAPALIQMLRDDAEKEQLQVVVHANNFLDEDLPLPENHYKLVFLSEVTAHFRNSTQLKRLFENAERILQPGGLLLFNVFMPLEGYKADELAIQVSQANWCSLFTRGQLAEAQQGLAFELLSNESTPEYEKTALPPEHWPPNGWYETWTTGQDLFDLPAAKCPIELRWITYRKKG
jgi:SAM-dependent methyltransferase